MTKRQRERHYDHDYEKRIVDGVLEVITRESLSERDGQRVAMIKSNEVWNAFLKMGAVFVSGADDLSSPTKVREFSNEQGKRLGRLITEARAKKADRDFIVDLPSTYDD